mmetsp:Transcript_42814/g.62696  ORF Transcript_42814/g.62696 Transcript_42814/m.62696 type:complete len:121 (+) Transcript_42814:404-766(+)
MLTVKRTFPQTLCRHSVTSLVVIRTSELTEKDSFIHNGPTATKISEMSTQGLLEKVSPVVLNQCSSFKKDWLIGLPLRKEQLHDTEARNIFALGSIMQADYVSREFVTFHLVKDTYEIKK